MNNNQVEVRDYNFYNSLNCHNRDSIFIKGMIKLCARDDDKRKKKDYSILESLILMCS